MEALNSIQTQQQLAKCEILYAKNSIKVNKKRRGCLLDMLFSAYIVKFKFASLKHD